MAVIINPQPSPNKSNVVTPEDMMTQETFNEMMAMDMASLMKAYESIRKYCYELGEHHNKLVQEYKKDKQDLTERIEVLERHAKINTGVKSVTAEYSGPGIVTIKRTEEEIESESITA